MWNLAGAPPTAGIPRHRGGRGASIKAAAGSQGGDSGNVDRRCIRARLVGDSRVVTRTSNQDGDAIASAAKGARPRYSAVSASNSAA